MRFVRCEACGAKALVAASQCPRCSHPLELRDDSGNEVPLAHCRTCDTFYPRRRGSCRWCGTTARGVRPAPFVWTGLTIVALAGGAFGTWTVRARTRTLPVAPRRALATAQVRVASNAGVLDSAPPASHSAPAPTPSAPIPAVTEVSSVTTASAATLPVSTPSPAVEDWVDKTVHTWVNVRADASRESEILGVVTPDTRVQLGESRAGWVRIKAPGLSGWVGRRAVLTDSSKSPP